MKNLLKILTLASILVAPMSYAATISSLNDGFETEASTSTLNYNSFANWDVTAGTVDLIKNGNSWGITSSEGDYSVDLDGSSGNAGVLTSKDGFAAGTYMVSFDISGNQRNGFDILDVTFDGVKLVDGLVKQAGDNFITLTFLATVSEGAKLAFANLGGDNLGMILDNVSVSAVPVPAALFLFAPALMGMVGLRRKMKVAAV